MNRIGIEPHRSAASLNGRVTLVKATWSDRLFVVMNLFAAATVLWFIGVLAGVFPSNDDAPIAEDEVTVISSRAEGAEIEEDTRSLVTCVSDESYRNTITVPTPTDSPITPTRVPQEEIDWLNGQCQPLHPLVGQDVHHLGVDLVDPDQDGNNEWTCTPGVPVENNLSTTVRFCVELEQTGPGADTFRTQQGSLVERLDVDGDRNTDFVLVGGELHAVERPQPPWWIGVVALPLALAFISIVGPLATSRWRREAQSEDT